MKLLPINVHYLLLFIPLFVVISCKDDEILYPDGGYDYPKHVEDKDTTFYFYPLKDNISTEDSFKTANTYSFLNGFDEYNLSLRPNDKPTFRFTYFGSPTAVVTLFQDQIIVKELIKGFWFDVPDTTKLSSKEKIHFDILERFFPLNDTSYKKWKKIYLDSFAAADPELLDPNYYKYLLDKTGAIGINKFEYSLKKVPITKKTFVYLLNQINRSGYWQLPFENWCDNIPTDVNGFMLEANTPKKYNAVNSLSCPDDSTKYTRACQELIKYAQMDSIIKLIWDGRVTTDTPDPIKVRELKLIEVKEEPVKKKKKAK
ncbi:MAG TPA: hypothetical protein VK492_05670 [Chitinophagaceae bacterium]|nr:hypothetical protein [Chitinophagaceae bacterium]